MSTPPRTEPGKPKATTDSSPAQPVGPETAGPCRERLEPAAPKPKESDSTEISSEERRRNRMDDMLLAEWKDVRESLRYFGNKRFAQLTVFITANGLMINAYFGKDNPMPGLWGGILGMLLAVLFGLNERSFKQFFENFAERGREIEERLEVVRLIRCRPTRDAGTLWTYSLYGTFFAVWFLIGCCDLVGLRPPSLHPQWAADVHRWLLQAIGWSVSSPVP